MSNSSEKSKTLPEHVRTVLSSAVLLDDLLSRCSSLRKLAKALNVPYSLLVKWINFHDLGLPTKEDMAIAKFYESLVECYPSIEVCWHWKGKKLMRYQNKSVHPRRFAMEQILGIRTDRKMIIEACSDPECVNPFHMSFRGHREYGKKQS